MDCVVIATLNGDFLSPSVFTTLDGGRVMADALSEACIDYVCLGNHEFDLGPGKAGGTRAKIFLISFWCSS